MENGFFFLITLQFIQNDLHNIIYRFAQVAELDEFFSFFDLFLKQKFGFSLNRWDITIRFSTYIRQFGQ